MMVDVRSLGQIKVTFNADRMIVSGPDNDQNHLIAKQLSSGAAKLATLNGKQVLIMTRPTVTQSAALPNNVKFPSEPLALNVIKDYNVEQPQQCPVQVTAELILTSKGPRIVMQGIQGDKLPKEQLHCIQQQVKEQLLKAQSVAKLQGKVPPTKIAIQLPPITSSSKLTSATPSTPVLGETLVKADNPGTPSQIITTSTGNIWPIFQKQNAATTTTSRSIVVHPDGTTKSETLNDKDLKKRLKKNHYEFLILLGLENVRTTYGISEIDHNENIQHQPTKKLKT
jgi:hypothetical protein